MKAFVAVSYKHKDKLYKVLKTIELCLKKHNIKPIILVWDKYKYSNKELMHRALSEIKTSNIFIAELTYKAVGVGIELGYAYACSLKIIYLKKEGSKISKTTSGIATKSIVYKNREDLEKKLCYLLTTNIKR